MFTSAASRDVAHSLFEATVEEADVKARFVDMAAEIVLAVDASKLGKRPLVAALPRDCATTLVTEMDSYDGRLASYRS